MITLTSAEFHALFRSSGGACVFCGHTVSYGIEPDAVYYRCPACGKMTLCGTDTLLFDREVELVGDEAAEEGAASEKPCSGTGEA